MSNLCLENLAAECSNCTKCALEQTRTNVVFGAGTQNAEIMFVGEAPGKNEDLKGEPFVGAAGKLLDKLLCGIGFSRENVYIANILKCRPPGNRNPKAGEVKLCTPWLEKQIAALCPKVLVTLGNFATKFILQTKQGITDLHGQLHALDSSQVLPTFQPVAKQRPKKQVTQTLQVLPMFHPAAVIYDRSKIDALKTDFELLKSLVSKW